MKTTCNEVLVNANRKKALINHFIRELFGNDGIRAKVREYAPDEYVDALLKFTAFPTASLLDCTDNLHRLYEPEKEILLSFLKLHALDMLDNSEVVSIKDHLANHLAVTSILHFTSHNHLE